MSAISASTVHTHTVNAYSYTAGLQHVQPALETNSKQFQQQKPHQHCRGLVGST